jgi:DNA-binding XRE family transcriptional regulator
MVIATKLVTSHAKTMSTKSKNLLPDEMRDQMRPERIGYRLKLLRVSHGLTPSEMADMLDIERTYWSRFEGGKRAVSDTVAALLVARFGVTLDFLILGRWDKLPLDLAEKLRAAEPQ